MQAAEQNKQELEWLLQGDFPVWKREDSRLYERKPPDASGNLQITFPMLIHARSAQFLNHKTPPV